MPVKNATAGLTVPQKEGHNRISDFKPSLALQNTTELMTAFFGKRKKKEKHQLEDATVSEMSKCENVGEYILETEET